MLQPVVKRTVAEAVFEQLKDHIVDGSLEPGAKLPAERELASRLGVNRNAIREALQRLAQLRMIAIQPGGATRILGLREQAGLEVLGFLLFGRGREVRADAVRGLFEIRTAIGQDIAARAATRRPDAVVPRLEAIVERMAATPDGDPVVLQQRSLELWRLLVDASGNVAYPLLMNTLDVAYKSVDEIVAPALANELRDLAGFRALVRAVASQDGPRARRAAERLLVQGEEGVAALVAKGGVLSKGDRR